MGIKERQRRSFGVLYKCDLLVYVRIVSNYSSGHYVAVAAEEFCCGMNDDVGTVF